MAVVAAAMMLLSSLSSDDDTAALAAEVGIDEVALGGAVNTTQSTPRAYLEHEGLLSPPVQQAASVPSYGVWDRLAQCESGGDWSAVSRSGLYRGGLQFDQQTWAAYGGQRYASSAHLASRAQQIAVAESLRTARGFAPWPVCGRGLR